MKLWQGWHNTDLGRSYFHYGPLGGTKKQMGILAQTCKKRGVKSTWKKSGKWKKAKWEVFYLIVEKYMKGKLTMWKPNASRLSYNLVVILLLLSRVKSRSR